MNVINRSLKVNRQFCTGTKLDTRPETWKADDDDSGDAFTSGFVCVCVCVCEKRSLTLREEKQITSFWK